jgi:hypothetical protein
MYRRRYQRLKVTEPTQWVAGRDRLPGIAAEPMKPIVALGAKDPYNRIGVSVRRGCNSGTAAAEATAPAVIIVGGEPPEIFRTVNPLPLLGPGQCVPGA